MNVAQWLERSARAFGDRPALASGTQRCATYAEFRARAGRLADGMRRMGARPGAAYSAGTVAPRPPSERLICTKLRLRDEFHMRDWRVCLREYVDNCYRNYL